MNYFYFLQLTKDVCKFGITTNLADRMYKHKKHHNFDRIITIYKMNCVVYMRSVESALKKQINPVTVKESIEIYGLQRGETEIFEMDRFDDYMELYKDFLEKFRDSTGGEYIELTEEQINDAITKKTEKTKPSNPVIDDVDLCIDEEEINEDTPVEEESINTNKIETNKHICMRCGKTFSQKKNLINHLISKKVCPSHLNDVTKSSLLKNIGIDAQSIKEFDCDKCFKTFMRNDHLTKHKQVCSPKDSEIIMNMRHKIKQRDEKINILEKQISNMRNIINSHNLTYSVM